jgi:signal transduction histidine kinase
MENGGQPTLEEMQTLFTVQQKITSHLDTQVVVQLIADGARQLIPCQGTIVSMLDGEDLRVAAISASQDPVDGLIGYRRPVKNSLVGLAVRSGKAYHCLDAEIDGGADKELVLLSGMRSFLSVPLTSQVRPIGALLVGDRQPRIFNLDDERLLTMLAGSAVIALENARTHERAQELTRLHERQQIVQTLHDSVLQMLFTIGLEAESCQKLPGFAEDARAKLELIGRLAARSSHELRSAMLPLAISSLAVGAGLVALLEEAARGFQARTGIATTLVVPDGFAYPPSLIGEAIYRIVRESFSNVRKHAQAAAVIVSLRSAEASISVTIQDNGIGLARPLSMEKGKGGLHFGVTAMRQLTLQAGGEFLIANNDDQGVLVRATFPLPGGGLP